MAEGGEAGAPPVRLWVRRVGVYCDEHRKTWLVTAEEASVCFELPRGCSIAVSGASAALPVTACSVCYFPPGGSLVVLKNCCLNSCLGINMFLNMSRKDPCQKQACEIQKCLQANNYMESKCEAVLQEMRKCCARYTKGRSICCSGFEREEREREKVKLASEGISPPPQ
ncbi:uncharacterized protein ACIQIH_012769 isoform 2-T6 [Cyanocitta cristata]